MKLCTKSFALLVALATQVSLVLGICSYCSNSCTSFSYESQYDGMCKCDGNCGLYGDCCESSLITGTLDATNCTVDTDGTLNTVNCTIDTDGMCQWVGNCEFCEIEFESDMTNCTVDTDGMCQWVGNCECCEFEDLSNCIADTVVPSGVDFVCHSIYPDSRIKPLQSNESFWMVSSCPNSWSADTASQVMVRDNCVSLSSSLPPITDLDTGTVYANEFCAICNRAENLVAWQPNLACTPYVYEQLDVLNNNVQQLLRNDPTIFQTQCQACSYQVPTISTIPPPRPCFAAVSTCASKSHLEALTGSQYSVEGYDSLVNRCVNGPYDLVSQDEHGIPNKLFRNEACAACNGLRDIACFSPLVRYFVPSECAPEIPTTKPPTTAPILVYSSQPNSSDDDIVTVLQDLVIIIPAEPTFGIPFTIALSNLGGGQVQVSVESETVTVEVNCPDGQAAVGLNCRPTFCPEGYEESGGQCPFQINAFNNNGTAECSSDLITLNTSDFLPLSNNTVLHNNQMLTVIEFDRDGRPVVCPNFLFRCPSGFIALNDSEFISLGNDTIQFGGEEFDIIGYDIFGRPYICPPNNTVLRNVTIYKYTYPEGFLILTYIGCSLSVIGSALILLTYGIFKSLRTLPSLVLMNLAVTIILNNLFILIGGPVTQAFPSVELCTAVAICLHFFFLAQFTWMSIMSFQMARSFYQAKQLKFDTKCQKQGAFAVYFVFGWSVPLLITCTSIIVNFTTEHLVLYGVLEDGRLGSCWINHFESAVVTFLVPLVIFMTINLVLFVVVTVFLCLAYRSSAKLDKSHNLPFLRVNVAVFSVTGLTWIFGFIALLAGTSWAWYPFIVFNSTQGFVIFIAFLLTRRVFELYRDLLLCHKSRGSTETEGRASSCTNKVKTPPKDSLNYSTSTLKVHV